ncbi:putative P-loop containing nucleoside triphosphate hydrolase, leucine-rich repeat domain, L [Rosa chinensis]|uniref:Putative P-loop containing nucleoside triphosphate hydrolase, leucine-rich repeat domain, L n=1 Tax=Rosa chinensis TaxID=74649 RepID=A0A2P6QDZ0_ROSCH|nr:putative disease resistance RPP13-like protein 1 [Rosa chinensis]XP_040362359.1 putative disease resistance RPP13-like protein 1 [Rosa chinensis]XP_040362360.1 putative disease resistance RPP13-like protein 1 [Rosa chinensis]XP_040362361.1 putative disease resistance RPP13-like protein 1 [Rosa chinensis]XP_040362362.1 putative disease resistance RPP13-like protein 1 [Rosa chinensis]XP_040362363.1 putative disease resistance RPP13-like protein 1 [Rosa chinensis]XP_040362364.1 putative disea
MALEVVGGAFLSSALAVLFDRMASRPVLDFIRGKKNAAGLLHKLKIKLLSVNKLLDDAEEKQLRNSRVREWLNELKHVLYHADDLLDEIKTEALRCKMEQEDSGSSSTNQVLKFSSISIHELDESLEPRILEILDRLQLIVDEKDVLDLKEGVKDGPQGRLPTTSLVEESSVYGRDEEKEAIIKLLLADGMTGNKTDVLPIVGMGGLGKTTLAQLVYNDDRVKQRFAHRSWSCVSEEFDVIKITQTIYGAVTSQTCNITDLDMLQVELKKTLTGKKFLFVLDDVWDVNLMKWDLLSRPFESGGHGSKIIVTTRNEDVACRTGTLPSEHLVQLSEENCWLLFSKHAFKNAGVTADPLLEVIGKQIAQKCKGLPLAAKSLGGLLRSEPNIEKWQEILNNDIWELQDKGNDILPALWLSYHYLPPHLKRCFAYCSIFPQDYEFYKSKLVLLWMAEDLLPLRSKTTIEEVGENYFDDLVSRSFFQHVPNHFSGAGEAVFTMHDLIHDLANFVSGEFCVRLENNDSVLENVSKSRHFSCMDASAVLHQWDSLYEAKYLRTFLVLKSGGLSKLDFDIFLKLQCLRVLHLSGSVIVELPSSISKLKHLRHLDLSYLSIKKLPDEMCTLYNLQTLLLSFSANLVELPTDLGRLINLRHLDIFATRIEKMPPRMGKMKDLQTLSGVFVLDKYTGDNIVEIKELQQLRGTLRISGLRNIVHVTDAIMRRKKHVDELVLEWGGKSGDTDDTQKERDVLENLQPHTNLKKLAIQSYGGTRFPGWLEDLSSLSNLVRLRLLDCGNCLSLPSVEQLPSLQELEIQGFNGVATVGSKPFPNLRKLRLKSCPEVTGAFMLACFPKLEILDLVDVNVESLNSPSLLSLVELTISSCPNFVCFPDGGLDAPNLETIKVHECSKLRSLPQHMHNLLPSLRRLFVHDCPELESFPEGGLPSKLQCLYLGGCKKLLIGNRMQWGLPTLTSLYILSVNFERYEQVVDSFPDEGLLPTTLSRLDIYGISKLDGKGFTQLTSLKELAIHDCSELRGLPDEGLPTSLSYLLIRDCPLLEQRCQRETGEDWPKIAHIKSIFINLYRI